MNIVSESNTSVGSPQVNSFFAPPISKSIPHPNNEKTRQYTECSHTTWFGASVEAYHKLAVVYGYSLVYCESRGVNCFMVRNDVLGFRASDYLLPHTIHRPPTYGTNCGGHRNDPQNREFQEITQALLLERKQQLEDDS